MVDVCVFNRRFYAANFPDASSRLSVSARLTTRMTHRGAVEPGPPLPPCYYPSILYDPSLSLLLIQSTPE